MLTRHNTTLFTQKSNELKKERQSHRHYRLPDHCLYIDVDRRHLRHLNQ